MNVFQLLSFITLQELSNVPAIGASVMWPGLYSPASGGRPRQPASRGPSRTCCFCTHSHLSSPRLDIRLSQPPLSDLAFSPPVPTWTLLYGFGSRPTPYANEVVPGFCWSRHPGVRWGALALGALRLDIGNVLPPRRCWRAVVGCLGRFLRLGQPRRRGQRRRRVYTTSFAGHSATAPPTGARSEQFPTTRARATRRAATATPRTLPQR